MGGQEWTAMTKLVNNLYNRQDTEPFREPVDWKGMGLYDYPQIIKRPMDLGTVKRKLENNSYTSVQHVAEDVRQIWKNCMTYNADGSDFYVLAQNLSKKFEDKYAKSVHPLTSSGSGGGGGGGSDRAQPGSSSGGVPDCPSSSNASSEPTLDEKRAFAKSLYKITKEQLGKVITDLDERSPTALTKNAAEDEVEINVDAITPSVFHQVVDYVRSCSGENGTNASSSGGGGSGSSRKKKTGGNKAKKARTS